MVEPYINIKVGRTTPTIDILTNIKSGILSPLLEKEIRETMYGRIWNDSSCRSVETIQGRIWVVLDILMLFGQNITEPPQIKVTVKIL
jgi:hypothetical protein